MPPPDTSAAAAEDITAAVCRLGATVAGIVSIERLLRTPSQRGRRHPFWPKWAASALVFGLDHPPGNLPLDHWGGKYGTLGNRRLIGIADRMIGLIGTRFGFRAASLPYPPASGGIFLKEAAVAAGIGVIGKNNLLVSPVHGTHLRFRALMVDHPFDSTPVASGFDPCRGCDAPCRRRCPQDAFRDGAYNLERCRRQMQLDRECRLSTSSAGIGGAGRYLTQFCRICELFCPVGEDSGGGASMGRGCRF